MAEGQRDKRWNGVDLDWCNWLALHWAFEVAGPRLKALGFNPAERLVLQSIAKHTNPDNPNVNLSRPGYALVRLETGYSRTWIAQTVDRLELAGVIAIDRREGRGHIYTIRPELDGHVWTRQVALPVPVNSVDGSNRSSDLTTHSSSNLTTPIKPVDHHPSSDLTRTTTIEKEVVEKEEELTTTAAPLASRSSGQHVSGQNGQSKTSNRKPPTNPNLLAMQINAMGSAQNNPAQPVKPDAASEVAEWFYGLIGEPQRERAAAQRDWPTTFRPLIEEQGETLVRETLTWASQHERYWHGALARYREDSAQHAVESFGDMLFQISDEAERNLRNPQSAAPATQAKPQPTKPIGGSLFPSSF